MIDFGIVNYVLLTVLQRIQSCLNCTEITTNSLTSVAVLHLGLDTLHAVDQMTGVIAVSLEFKIAQVVTL